jgi:hypothetical protein
MKTATKVSQLVRLGSGALLLVLGLIIWTGHGDQLIGIHTMLGFLLVLPLWAVAAIAARSGVVIGLEVGRDREGARDSGSVPVTPVDPLRSVRSHWPGRPVAHMI